jgi:hypothetical protein
MPWTAEQVLALAPDAASAKAGKELGAARKWATLGADGACAWGTLQGSGKDPYQTCLDPAGPAFKCSCPSRKFPCKHGLGLFLVLAQQPAALTEKTPPAWAAEWLAKRADREDKKAAKAAVPDAPPDPAAAAQAAASAERRVAAREARVTAGLEELGRWLADLVRAGLASLPGRPAAFWETPAARLVDAQVPGLARRLRALDGVTATGDGWPARLLREAAALHLACTAWPRAASLPAATRADLRAVLGLPLPQEEVLASPGVRDRWLVLGQRVVEEDRLRTQRAWLWGRGTGRPALYLSFSASPGQPLDLSLVPGHEFEGELAYFPGAWPLRALVKERSTGDPVAPAAAALPHASVAAANAFAAAAWTANPWLERLPLALAAVVPVRRAAGWLVRDAAGQALPLAVTDAAGWSLAALAGGRPLALAGEWDGERLAPLGAWAEGRFLPP